MLETSINNSFYDVVEIPPISLLKLFILYIILSF